jgi:hypothetical protein
VVGIRPVYVIERHTQSCALENLEARVEIQVFMRFNLEVGQWR